METDYSDRRPGQASPSAASAAWLGACAHVYRDVLSVAADACSPRRMTSATNLNT